MTMSSSHIISFYFHPKNTISVNRQTGSFFYQGHTHSTLYELNKTKRARDRHSKAKAKSNEQKNRFHFEIATEHLLFPRTRAAFPNNHFGLNFFSTLFRHFAPI